MSNLVFFMILSGYEVKNKNALINGIRERMRERKAKKQHRRSVIN